MERGKREIQITEKVEEEEIRPEVGSLARS